jgi:hypothetical protein
MKKWAHELNIEFSKEEAQMTVKTWRTVQHLWLKRGTNENYTKISSHPS